ncbi:sugar-binding transcriptional regulator [Anaerostipes sp.]|uniref:sugar-binding transcriptional regulator n=1 Tax=Anaerostipes sp. TaxID=1872530 RepID=UPI0025BBFA95|nr:sugar-binding domain-containing protein [Anaerostipes sp.]MBS7009653.1 helix-turn-helix domain-containing protein [Anaerostipes sp.]
MRKIIDDQRLIYQCCSLYYEDQMGQSQIAKHLGISKSSVSRMLQTGRELGIVEIKVRHLSQYMYKDLEEELKSKYHLKDVVVAESGPLDSKEERIFKLNERAADYLNRLLKDGDFIGVSVGSSIRNLAKTSQKTFHRKCTFVPLVGGISQHTAGMEEVQSNQVAEALAEKYGGNYVSFFSPAVFSNEKLMEEFLKEEAVRFIFDYFKKLNIVISGMNISSSMYETVNKLGYVSKEQLDSFREKGAVCNLILRFLDRHGNTKPFDEYNRRIAGISAEAYQNVEYKLLITGGAKNSGAVKSCIRGNFANILIMDVDCAKALLSDDADEKGN